MIGYDLFSGIFSDTHVLSLLYAGEMCFWYLKYSTSSSLIAPLPSTVANDVSDDDKNKSQRAITVAEDGAEADEKCEFNAREVGRKLLRLYLDVVAGPLKGHGWREERAAEILSFIENYNTTVNAEVASTSA